MKLDILAFGAHPDDVELSCAGTLIKHVSKGHKVGVVDLTQGELGTKGTVEIRREEASKASEIMGLSIRENAMLADGLFELNHENKLKIIHFIRKYKPEIVLINAPSDRHPDHGRAHLLCKEACFLSGLKNILTEDNFEAWRPKLVLAYIQDCWLEPSFVVDVSISHSTKMKAILAYNSQFFNKNDNSPTYIGTKSFLIGVETKSQTLGKRIGSQYGEGFIIPDLVGVDDLDDLYIPKIS